MSFESECFSDTQTREFRTVSRMPLHLIYMEGKAKSCIYFVRLNRVKYASPLCLGRGVCHYWTASVPSSGETTWGMKRDATLLRPFPLTKKNPMTENAAAPIKFTNRSFMVSCRPMSR